MTRNQLFSRAAAGLLFACILISVSAANDNAEDARESKLQLPAGGLDGVAIDRQGLADLQANLAKTISSAPSRLMVQSGLAGAMGAIRVKLSSVAPQEVLIPIPQLADGQVPICFFINSNPPEAVTEYRLRKRDDCNVVVNVRLAGITGDVEIQWSSLVLISARNVIPNATGVDSYREATACVQSHAEEITELAQAIWPPSGKASDFALNIQRQIREMKRKGRPRTLDALGILQSGESSICTANANLASALMRAKGVACRSIAVIPPNSQKLEMHRIVEFNENGTWLPFDPSSVQTRIPTLPFHNIIVAKTTSADEQTAMKPRMGTMVGCPYGQELELLTSAVNIFGQDFFWTLAKPLADIEPSDEAIRLAIEAWNSYLNTGTLTPGQLKAVAARTDNEFVTSLQTK